MALRAIVTGIYGQDGAYLAQWLLRRGYEVYGGFRSDSPRNGWRLRELAIADEVRYLPFDLRDQGALADGISAVRPDELYNLAAESFVASSFERPLATTDVNALGVLRLLESLRSIRPECRFFQASTSEMFGSVEETPQSERTPFRPRNPYAISKLYAHWLTANYREVHGMHGSCGILFNHESPLRGTAFVTRKITLGLARHRQGQRRPLELGNLDGRRDWGFAGDYVRAMWQMLQQPKGDEYVLATGGNHTVREFVGMAAVVAGIDLLWEGEAEHERAVDRKTGETIVRVNPALYRPTEPGVLLGDASKAVERLAWNRRVSFEGLVERMVRADMDRVSSGRVIA
jgi:GDPmannose 4,6-dehydratase